MSSQTVTCQLVREVAVTQNASKSCQLMCQRQIWCTKIKEISTGNDICVGDTCVLDVVCGCYKCIVVCRLASNASIKEVTWKRPRKG